MLISSLSAKAYQSTVISLLMTGMGRDGVEGCKAILAGGGLTLGQDEATSAVYGMNKATFLEEGPQGESSPLDELPGIIQNIIAFRASLESTTAGD